jgi:hypothetical protein
MTFDAGSSAMRSGPLSRWRLRCAATLAAAALPLAAAAQSADAWQFDAAVYLYLPTLGGTTKFDNGGGGSAVTIDGSKIVDSLQATFMGSFEVRRGPWGAYFDYVYVDLDQSKSGSRDLSIGGVPLPADASADLQFGLTGTAWTAAGLYRLVPDPKSPVDVFVGARLLDIKQTFGWQLNGNVGQFPLPGRGGNQEAQIHNWDGIVGVKGRWAFGADGRWFVPYYADIGTGDSSLTWQATAGIGYSFGSIDVTASWRYLEYRMKSPKIIETLNFNGPAAAVVFRW